MSRPAGQRLRDLDTEAHLDDPALRQRYVTAVFDLIAPRYDSFTRWFSFGMDALWKREVVRLAEAASAVSDSPVIADLACGTGDIGSALAGPGRRVLGLDVSIEMLGRAGSRRRRTIGPRARLVAGDMIALPLRDASVDVVTIGYGLRNASHLGATLDEVTRVLRPGGQIIALDFFKPANPIWRTLFLSYLAVAGSLYGWAWHREPAAYGYIPHSIRRFITANELTAELAARGFDVYRVAPKLFGGICVHAAKAQALPPDPARLAHR